ncbi:MAG: DeoR family transcriptional regulator, partial [Marivita lacus]|nr:DeoR family transcriptional regulator [Marivita lacus]
PARIASLSEIDTLFTDAPLPADLPERCEAWDTEVVVTQAS